VIDENAAGGECAQALDAGNSPTTRRKNAYPTFRPQTLTLAVIFPSLNHPRRALRTPQANRWIGALRRRLSRPGSRTYGHHYAREFRPYRAQLPAQAPPNRPRVTHVIGNFYTGGSSRLVVDLIEGLSSRFEQRVLTRDAPSPPSYVGVDIRSRPSFADPDEVLDEVASLRPDLVHVHYLGHDFSRLGEGDWEWYVSLFEGLERYDVPVLENVNIPISPYVSKAVDRYVYVSDYVRERFGDGSSHSVTIYPGSDVERFCRFGAPPPDDCVGMVYRLEEDKLDEHAIDVFIEIVRRRPQTTALIVGGGPLRQRYIDAARSAGVADAFTFTGYVAYDDLPDVYGRMSVFVAPVHSESFGHVVPLAMSMGIPVAGYDVGGVPEIVGDPLVLAPPGDVDGLTRIVQELLDERPRRLALGTTNRERARAHFSVDAMVARYGALYDELLEARAR
jgi:glycosyltransferase involved in cell wall biosynthesis